MVLAMVDSIHWVRRREKRIGRDWNSVDYSHLEKEMVSSKHWELKKEKRKLLAMTTVRSRWRERNLGTN